MSHLPVCLPGYRLPNNCQNASSNYWNRYYLLLPISPGVHFSHSSLPLCHHPPNRDNPDQSRLPLSFRLIKWPADGEYEYVPDNNVLLPDYPFVHNRRARSNRHQSLQVHHLRRLFVPSSCFAESCTLLLPGSPDLRLHRSYH